MEFRFLSPLKESQAERLDCYVTFHLTFLPVVLHNHADSFPL